MHACVSISRLLNTDNDSFRHGGDSELSRVESRRAARSVGRSPGNGSNHGPYTGGVVPSTCNYRKLASFRRAVSCRRRFSRSSPHSLRALLSRVGADKVPAPDSGCDSGAPRRRCCLCERVFHERSGRAGELRETERKRKLGEEFL